MVPFVFSAHVRIYIRYHDCILSHITNAFEFVVSNFCYSSAILECLNVPISLNDITAYVVVYCILVYAIVNVAMLYHSMLSIIIMHYVYYIV